VNFLSLSGLQPPQVAQLLGQNAQTMAAFAALQELLSGLMPAGVSAAAVNSSVIASTVVGAVYDRIMAVDASDAAKVGCGGAPQHGPFCSHAGTTRRPHPR
jgi:hypothetical protein